MRTAYEINCRSLLLFVLVTGDKQAGRRREGLGAILDVTESPPERGLV